MKSVMLPVSCIGCLNITVVQANFVDGNPIAADAVTFPGDDKLSCDHCGINNELDGLRETIETDTGMKIL